MRDHLIKHVKKNTVYSKVVLIVYYTKHVKPFRQTFQYSFLFKKVFEASVFNVPWITESFQCWIMIDNKFVLTYHLYLPLFVYLTRTLSTSHTQIETYILSIHILLSKLNSIFMYFFVKEFFYICLKRFYSFNRISRNKDLWL